MIISQPALLPQSCGQEIFRLRIRLAYEHPEDIKSETRRLQERNRYIHHCDGKE